MSKRLKLFHEMSRQEQLQDDQRRRHGRVLCQDVECSLGEVADVSASGMRVLCAHKPPAIGTKFTTTVHGLDGPVLFSCVVMWTKRCGFFKVEVGVEFRDVNDLMRQALARLARASAQNECLRKAA